MSEPVWYRLECLVEDVDNADVLWELGAAGVEIQDHETFMEGGSIQPVPEGTARLIAFFDLTDADPDALASVVEDRLTPRSSRLDRFEDTSWQTAWKDYFHPVRLSARSMVGPPWEEFSAPDGGLKIVIEPGMAFGTGTHETTQLVGEILDEIIGSTPPATLLDVGCGSAILSMLAKGLGVGHVVGVDVDATAVEIARETVRANGYDDIELSTKPIQGFDEEYPVVLANILGHILLSIREHLVRVTEPGGELLVSGVTVEQEDDFFEEFAGSELELLERRVRGEWVAFRFRRSA